MSALPTANYLMLLLEYLVKFGYFNITTHHITATFSISRIWKIWRMHLLGILRKDFDFAVNSYFKIFKFRKKMLH